MPEPARAGHFAQMADFVAILLLFLASHSIPARPALRARLVRLLGEKLYLTIYGAVSTALLVWLIVAARHAPYISLWPPTLGLYWVPILVMRLALFLFVGGLLSPNPLSVGFRGASFDPARPSIVGITRHPLLWAFALWGLSHVVPNGDLVSVIMFGGFALFALVAMPVVDRRKRRELGPRWEELAAIGPALPFAGRSRRWAWPRGLLPVIIVATIAVYAGLLLAHPWLFGPDPTVAFQQG